VPYGAFSARARICPVPGWIRASVSALWPGL